MTMRVVADLDICQGHQMCQAEAPTVFGFDEAVDVVEVLEPHPDESLRPQVEAAVRYCPAFALTIVDPAPDPAPDPTPDPMSEEDR